MRVTIRDPKTNAISFSSECTADQLMLNALSRAGFAPVCQPVTPASITAAHVDGLLMLLADWQRGLAEHDDDLLDWLAPRIVARAHLTFRHARRKP